MFFFFFFCLVQVEKNDFFLLFFFLSIAYCQSTNDRNDTIERVNSEWKVEKATGVDVGVGGELTAENHGAEDFGGNALEQIGAATGTIADVVATQISNGGRIARVVLGNALLELAHNVGADVGRLRVDAAAELRKQCHKRRSEREADHHVRDLCRREAERLRHDAQQREQRGETERARRHHHQTRARACSQRQLN